MCIHLLLFLILKALVSYIFIFLSAPPLFFFHFVFVLSFDSSASDETQKSHKSRHRMHRSLGSSHKTVSRSLSGDSQSKGSICTPHGSKVCNMKSTVLFSFSFLSLVLAFTRTVSICVVQKVDLSKLEMAALWRYWRHFNLVNLWTFPFYQSPDKLRMLMERCYL